MPATFHRRWTDAMDELLIEYWRDHHTASEIYRLGLFPGFTRNAIIGRLFRLRKKRGELVVTHRDSDPAPPRKKKRRPNYNANEHAARPPTLVRTPPVPPTARRIPLLELGPHDCRFIVTGDEVTRHLYCAIDASDFVDDYGNGCYCAFHRRVMRATAPLRRL